MWRSVTVFSLSVKTYVGAPPIRRNVVSKAAMTEASDLSLSTRITRKRLQASQAQNKITAAPSMIGPAPKSYWSQAPGSVIQGL